uniref:CRAL-TRIO domain-containing protein n=1 Tax=Alexandrium monilatum TaxID=311494 RepID=A0A7S4Q212_9DINO
MQRPSLPVATLAGPPAFVQPLTSWHPSAAGGSSAGIGGSRALGAPSTAPSGSSTAPPAGAAATAVLVTVSGQRRRRRHAGRSMGGHSAALRVLSLGSGGSRDTSRSSKQLARERQADVSRCYLHLLGEKEEALLQAMRERVPAVVSATREQSSAAKEEHLKIWGVDVEAPSVALDMVLLKYLRAEDLDVERAAKRLAETLQFRVDSTLDALVDEELPEHFQGHDTIDGVDADGRPLMISRYGQMDNDKVFGDPDAFVRYRLQVMEKAMAKLRFEPGAPEDLCQVHDYSGVNLLFKSNEVKAGIAAMTKVFSAHYPETKGKTIFVKFPLLFSKLFQAFSVFIPEKTRKKFIILGEADQPLLFDHVPPEVVPEDACPLGHWWNAGPDVRAGQAARGPLPDHERGPTLVRSSGPRAGGGHPGDACLGTAGLLA